MKMRHNVLAAAFVSAFVMACAAQPASESATFPETDASAIRAASSAFQTAVRDTAWTTSASFYTNDVVFGPPNGPAISGPDAIVAFARGFPPFRDFTLREVDLDGRGDLAYVYGKYSWVLLLPGQPATPDSGKYIAIWRKQADGSWKITREIFNSDVPMPAAPATK
jgi:ketosteroid isomerase-like protein